MNFSPTQKKILLVSGIFVVVALVVSLAFRNFGEVGVDVVVLPKDSVLKVDGKVTSPGRVYLKPGTHTLTASRQYFSDATQTINTDDLQPDEKIYLLPKPDSQEAEEYLLNNPDVQAEREEAGGAEAQFNQEVTQETYPITAQLPYNTLDYSVNYSFNERDEIVFEVLLKPVAPLDDSGRADEIRTLKDAALDWLRSQKVDTQKAKIIFSPEK